CPVQTRVYVIDVKENFISCNIFDHYTCCSFFQRNTCFLFHVEKKVHNRYLSGFEILLYTVRHQNGEM
ncbi:hypothetical protein STEG23_021981, partial [Scotinomys teguina]